jgi:type IV pilus biogenesis protein PilP
MSSTSFRKPESRLLFSYPGLAGVAVGIAAVAAFLLAQPAEQAAPPAVPAASVQAGAAAAPAPEPELRPRAAPPLRLAQSERPRARPLALVPAVAARAPLVTASTRSVPWLTAAPSRANLPEMRLAELTTARARMVDAASPPRRPAATSSAAAALEAPRPMRRPRTEPRAALPIADLPELGRPRRRPDEPAVVVASLAPANASIAGLAAPVATPPARPAAIRAPAARAPAPKPVAAAPAPKVVSPAPAPVRVTPVVVERRTAPAPVRQQVVRRALAPQTPSAALAGAAATERVGLARGRVSLIGVFGAASGRHALLLLPNGNVERVQAGDRIQGVQVASIGDDSVRLRRGGRDTLLRLPE